MPIHASMSPLCFLLVILISEVTFLFVFFVSAFSNDSTPHVFLVILAPLFSD